MTTFDQGGNVWEWNEQIVSGSIRGFRGGSWFDGGGIGLAAWYGFGGSPTIEGRGVGLRVASLVPEPDASPLALIVLAGLAARQEHRKRNL